MVSLRVFCGLSLLILLGSEGINGSSKSEFFTSVAGLEDILVTEKFLLSHLEMYVHSMTTQLQMLKSGIAEIEKEHATATNDLEEYLTSPVNAFLLIKRLDKDWSLYEDAVKNELARKSFLNALEFSRSNLSFPKEEETIGSVVALVRLQETYQLETSQLAAGLLNGVKTSASMSWLDCFQLGEELFRLKDYKHSIPWLKLSFQKLQAQKYFNSSQSIDFTESISSYFIHMGDFKTALELTNKVLELEPDSKTAQASKKYLEIMIKQGHGLVKSESIVDEMKPYRLTEEFKTYEKVCRFELQPSPAEERPLRCRNYHRNVPYRFLMPFKMEELSLDPYVVVFYDVIYDSEIEPIKEASRDSMTRSQPANNGITSTAALYRTSQHNWLRYDDLPQTRRLKQRLEDITGLNMDASEELQVANYGIGGHYEPHFDFFDTDAAFEPEDGNRVSTAIFYLSDVKLGGATAFPFLRRAVKPKKGSMMFWYNLHKDEQKDFRTKHAACPVLKGVKWVANVWTRVRGQMFNRPCGLQPDHEVSVPYGKVR